MTGNDIQTKHETTIPPVHSKTANNNTRLTFSRRQTLANRTHRYAFEASAHR